MVFNTTVTLHYMVQEKLINLLLNTLHTLSTTSFGISKPAPEKSLIKPLRMNIVSGVIEPSPMLPKVPNNMSSLSKASEYIKKANFALHIKMLGIKLESQEPIHLLMKSKPLSVKLFQVTSTYICLQSNTIF